MTAIDYIPPYQRALHQGSLRVLLVVQFLVVIPFIQDLPVWLLAVFAMVVVWRVRVLRGSMQKPSRWLVVSAIAVGIAGLYFSGLTQYSLDSAVSLCVLGYLLKSLETLRRRDAIFQSYLGYFLAGVFVLYHYDPLGALIAFGMLLGNTIAVQAATTEHDFRLRYAMKQSGVLLVAAIPVMIAGYLFFPRLPPLWQIPNEKRGAETGMTDEVAMGEIAELARSMEPAFRVAFDGEIPLRSQWYWRGSTMSEYDGQRWKAQFTKDNRWAWPRNQQLPEAGGESFRYDVTMVASQQHWLYFLDWPNSINSADGSVILPDARAARTESLSQAIRYSVQSSSSPLWAQLSEFERRQYLQLPDQGNERLAAWSASLMAEVNSDRAFIDAVLQHIRANPFYYTLKPPLYAGSSRLEEFWFGARRGFCSHYASTVGYIFRSVGIPTRLVGGYLGGVYNSNGNYIQVRQMEAHVWLEVWLEGSWVRIDPTEAVAPGRVEQTLDDLFADSQPSDLPLFSRMRGSIGMLNQLSMWWDAAQYQWQTWVIDYKSDTALGWFQKNFGQITPLKAAIAVLTLLGTVGFILAISLGILTWPKRLPEPYRSQRKIERWFGERELSETFAQYYGRISGLNRDVPALKELHKLVQAAVYDPAMKDYQQNLQGVMQKVVKQRQRLLGKQRET